FSPYSVTVALSMTLAGTANETRRQLAAALGLTGSEADWHLRLGRLIRLLDRTGQNSTRLLTANALWPLKGYPFLKSFFQTIKAHYGRALFPQDFLHQPEPSRLNINAWVARQTQDKIKDLLPPNSITGNVRLVLTNAVYFKSAWWLKFDPAKTVDADFSIAPGKKVRVKMMSLAAGGGLKQLGYADHGSLQVLEMPYADRSLSMFVLLPKRVDGLAEFERSLTPANLKKWLSSVRPGVVTKVFLPRFKITTPTIKINGLLKALGVKDAFDSDKADFSRLTRADRVWIDGVYHKAFIEVNEAGTEAAAATAVVIVAKSGGPRPEFRADRPFLFLLMDTRTGTILFMGRVMKPAA
ncbi:MAG: serpin family protein, partial [Proteobacteria bacterium]|nr:serpin family protein [Pseudomonadota bacterium]